MLLLWTLRTLVTCCSDVQTVAWVDWQRGSCGLKCPLHADSKPKRPDQAPVLLLHGFDSSSLEFRRLWPVLEESVETWAVDLVGWGFSDSGAAKHQKEMKLGPKQKRDHLYSFWQQKVGLVA